MKLVGIFLYRENSSTDDRFKLFHEIFPIIVVLASNE